MKRCRSVVLLWALVFGNALLQTNAVLRISFVEDLCYNTKLSVIDLKYDTTGILMSAPSVHQKGSFECEVNLVPPRGSSVVLSIFKYDLYGGDELIIEDSDRHRIALMGYGVFKDERKSVTSDGKMFIRYKTENTTMEHRRAGFQFTFTKVMKSPCSANEFKCNNEKCVLKELICDGHNHCGDRSDQMKCDIDETPKSKTVPDAPINKGALFTSLILVAAVILIVVIIVFVVCIVKGRKIKTALAKTPNSIPLQSSVPRDHSQSQASSSHVPNPSNAPNHASSIHVSVHSSVPRNVAVPSISGAQENSFYHRVRRSLRRDRAPENVPTQARVESYQVPSMYPSLDMEASAPEMYGVDNNNFRIEE